MKSQTTVPNHVNIQYGDFLKYWLQSFSKLICECFSNKAKEKKRVKMVRWAGEQEPELHRQDLGIYFFMFNLHGERSWWLRGKESACDAGDLGLIPGSGRPPGGGNGSPV